MTNFLIWLLLTAFFPWIGIPLGIIWLCYVIYEYKKLD